MRQARAVNINGIQKKPGNGKYKMGRKTSNFEAHEFKEALNFQLVHLICFDCFRDVPSQQPAACD